ncbi:MAG: TonB-dependent receptor [Prevotella sp.]|nr:TonB-dependent receptor [Prevotella sp.]
MQKRILLLVAMMLTSTLAIVAQVTNSAMTGVVTQQDTKEEVIGATVQAVHEPSGTKYAAVTNISGRFNIQGMRHGGPYTVTVSYIGYETKTFKNIVLPLGETYELNVWLAENANELTEIVVSGKATKFTGEKTGATTNINNRTIQELPTISRSIGDIAKLSPYYGGSNSFGGSSGRMSNFTLDGANLNNNFGLSANLPGGGTPVSMDAIDEVQVVVSPFDVRQTNFIGGGINAVTKSGTNTFKGTAYMYYSNNDMHGNRVDGKQNSEPNPDTNKTYGFTLGGPILKDKLFFFVNYERVESSDIPTYWHAAEDPESAENANTYTSRTLVSDMEIISDFVKEKYGYNTGSATNLPGGITNNKYLARLDWNINKDHHLALRYNHTNNSRWYTPSATSRDVGGLSSACVGLKSMAYSNAFYEMQNKVTTFSADLNSRFGEKISNQLLVTYTNEDDPRSSNSSVFPMIDIMKDGDPYITLGYELYTYNNRVQNTILTVNDNFTYYLGNHKLTAGLSFEHQMALNNYMRMGTGYYRYASMEDFMTGAAPTGVGLAYGYDGETKPSSKVRFNQIGIYLQDDWNIRPNLKVNAGIRFDNITFNEDDLKFNKALYDLDFGGRHLDVGSWPEANVQISPRVGFTWDVFGDKVLKLRGGTGLFAGRLPLVFFTNMPQNSGMMQNLVYARPGDSRLANFAGGLTTDIDQIREKLGAPYSQDANGVVPTAIAGVDKKFKMPQVWKTSFAVDYQLPVSFPLTLTGEFTYTKNINAVNLDNWNQKNPDETWQRLPGADDRWIYPADKSAWNYYTNYSNVCVLTNNHKGYGWTANVTLNAEPIKDLYIMAAYTHTVNKEVTGMPGSNASSAWSYLYTVNGPNVIEVRNSSYVTPDRVIANISYKYGKDHYSLFYSGYSPAGYSYTYGNDLNGDGLAYDLMYIPRDDSEIKFASDKDRVAFWEFVEQDDYLRNHKGEYADAYGARAPWVHSVDFKWAHDFDVKVGKTMHKLQLMATVENIGNLLNSSWGVAKQIPGTSNNQFKLLSVTNANDVKQGAQPIFRMNTDLTKTYDYNHSYGQCWRLQLGVKYYFN